MAVAAGGQAPSQAAKMCPCRESATVGMVVDS
jgi:hypothetical protein